MSPQRNENRSRVRSSVVDPDPYRYQFQANNKVNKLYFLSENINMLSKICIENYDPFDTDEKDKTL